MDLILIIVNNKTKRKKIIKYLNEIELPEFLALDSKGTYGVLNSDMQIRKGIDSIFDDQFDKLNKGRVISVINQETDKTKKIIDDIYTIIDINKEKFNTGIVLSIPINDIFDIKR